MNLGERVNLREMMCNQSSPRSSTHSSSEKDLLKCRFAAETVEQAKFVPAAVTLR